MGTTTKKQKKKNLKQNKRSWSKLQTQSFKKFTKLVQEVRPVENQKMTKIWMTRIVTSCKLSPRTTIFGRCISPSINIVFSKYILVARWKLGVHKYKSKGNKENERKNTYINIKETHVSQSCIRWNQPFVRNHCKTKRKICA